ncbi:hypothetical protein AB4254_11745 [Vibrio breoganii]
MFKSLFSVLQLVSLRDSVLSVGCIALIASVLSKFGGDYLVVEFVIFFMLIVSGAHLLKVRVNVPHWFAGMVLSCAIVASGIMTDGLLFLSDVVFDDKPLYQFKKLLALSVIGVVTYWVFVRDVDAEWHTAHERRIYSRMGYGLSQFTGFYSLLIMLVLFMSCAVFDALARYSITPVVQNSSSVVSQGYDRLFDPHVIYEGGVDAIKYTEHHLHPIAVELEDEVVRFVERHGRSSAVERLQIGDSHIYLSSAPMQGDHFIRVAFLDATVGIEVLIRRVLWCVGFVGLALLSLMSSVVIAVRTARAKDSDLYF